ncbi:hypothetical protein [Roseomonas sp. HF4]|nr:hypothetical protein [Roseomonas sp. HF4]
MTVLRIALVVRNAARWSDHDALRSSSQSKLLFPLDDGRLMPML